ALSYGGRESVVAAVRSLARRAAAKDIDPADIDEEILAEAFQTRELPPIDLVIRTSGERRISNFLIWETAHASFHATDTLWPDFSAAELLRILKDYSHQV